MTGPSAEEDAPVEVVYEDFDSPAPEDEWCWLAARTTSREAALNWANKAAADNRRRYLVISDRFTAARWLVYPQNTARVTSPGGGDTGE